MDKQRSEPYSIIFALSGWRVRASCQLSTTAFPACWAAKQCEVRLTVDRVVMLLACPLAVDY